MTKRALSFMILGAAVLAACDSDSLVPQSGPLRLEASIGDTLVGPGESLSIVFRVRNTGRDTLRLTFDDDCQTLPYITTLDGGAVYPGGGGWECTPGLTSLTLAPGAVDEKPVRRVDACGTRSGFLIQPGRYRAYARFVHADFPMQSSKLEFRVYCW